MDEPKHAVRGKPYVVGLCPLCIGTTVRNIGCEHCSQIGHLLATLALGKPLGIDGALFCFRIEELTPGVQVYDQYAPVHRLLMTAEAALGALALPGGGADTTHGLLLRRVGSAGFEHRYGWEGEWRAQ